MRKYNLLQENPSGDLRLSDLALHVLHNPQDSSERLDALREAGLSPELFSDLHQTYPHGSNDTLRSYLITKKGFSDTGAESCIKAFRDTQETAKLGDMGASAIPSQPPSNPQSSVMAPPIPSKASAVALPSNPVIPETESVARWPLGPGVMAEVRFIGKAKPVHLDLLKKYLDVAKDAMVLSDSVGVEPNVSTGIKTEEQ